MTEEYLSSSEASVILTQKLVHLLSDVSRAQAKSSLEAILIFFFRSKNLSIDTKKAESYAKFILDQIEKSLAKRMENSDSDLQRQDFLDPAKLF
jgi:hypothetical protein